MLTIQQMIRSVRDLQARVDKLESDAKKPVEVAPPPVFQVPSGSGRRGRPPKVTEADVAEATIDPIPPNEVVL